MSAPVPLASRLGAAVLARTAVTAAATAAAALSGAEPAPLDPARVAVAYTSERHFRRDGRRPDAFAELSGFFRAADGWVRTHANYPHHANALRRALGVADDAGRDAVTAVLGTLPAAVASARIEERGGLCVVVRAPDPAADALLRRSPLISVTPLGPATPVPLTPEPGAPLRGVRVLDLTRVIAGPVATQTLALLGATVLRIDPPHLPELEWHHLLTGHGKRSALLDLRGDRARFDALVDTADVVALGYRPAALDRLGLSPAALAARRPGLVVLRHSAWPDPARRGFDSLVQAESGIAVIEGSAAEPGVLPAQALDHSTGYLLAAEAMRLLRRRAEAGGSWLAETSLRRVAAELLAGPGTAQPEPAGEFPDPQPYLEDFRVGGLPLTTAGPAFVAGAGRFAAPRPWGGDEPVWVDEPD